ncbi:MAG: MBL fold metallo-hydrolase [Kiritimatiellales bacterium]|nr:MBL fold metallo-hydrolase [Kiritimatiellota bacterium]MBL7011441.1 MBL fold metallo-hydrolase [Kiritimatiellales bacterium]
MKLRFFGAAQNVTGSCYLIEANGSRILVDCGLYQERDLKERNWDDFPIPANTIDAVLLTHAHLDHSGRIPKLVKEGFKGPIYATAATADIAKIIMLDSAHIQEEDVKHKLKRHEKEGRTSPFPYEPLYTSEDAQDACELLQGVRYKQDISIADGISAAFFEAGHIFGSSSIKLKITQGDESRTILFSGDVGRWDVPIIRDPAVIGAADYVLVESTYGNRDHKPVDSIPDALADVVNQTVERGGNIIIPSFAVERTQELLFHLSNLLRDKRIPLIPAYVDSPMAVRVTEVFKRHPELFDDETNEMIRNGQHPCDFVGLAMSRTTDQSKAIKEVAGSAIIIAGSGMCTGGRIKHHLKNNITDAKNTILFVGYQAVGTLGRIILEGKEEIRIHGQLWQVNAHIERIEGFSAHADRNELMRWLSGIGVAPKKVFVVHGEPDAATAFAEKITEEKGWPVHVPAYDEEATLD